MSGPQATASSTTIQCSPPQTHDDIADNVAWVKSGDCLILIGNTIQVWHQCNEQKEGQSPSSKSLDDLRVIHVHIRSHPHFEKEWPEAMSERGIHPCVCDLKERVTDQNLKPPHLYKFTFIQALKQPAGLRVFLGKFI